ncbi:MAG: lipoyl synthase [Tepidiformaceae bacterium]
MDVQRPPWLKVRWAAGENFSRLRDLMREQKLVTVCEEARCPNIGDCWDRGTATFMILGDVCTRSCGFCAVTSGKPIAIDPGEPARIGWTVKTLGLRHAVVTSVNRDDQPDGGSNHFAETISWIRRLSPGTTIEVLIPDFMGNWENLATVMGAKPEILNHNTETVPRLYSRVRPKSKYPRSLELLAKAKEIDPGALTKSGLMVGLGETREELLDVFRDLATAGVDILTVGQYLKPDADHLDVVRYWHPDEFAELKERALEMGFRHIEAGPLVRSSYHAEEQAVSAPGFRQREFDPGEVIPLIPV